MTSPGDCSSAMLLLYLLISSYVPTGAENDLECFTDYLGRDYRGVVSITESGRTCQRWTSQLPYTHDRTPSNYPDSGLGDHNYCRNPDNWEYGAWCYTTDNNERYEACDIGTWEVTCDSTDRCQEDYVPFQNSCYKLHTNRKTRSEAKDTCEPQGHLVKITSSGENNFVETLMHRSSTNDAWFGLLKTDDLLWSDDAPLVSMDWHVILKNSGNMCFRIQRRNSGDYWWNDQSCNEEYPFVCESEANDQCPDGWSAFHSSCYVLSGSPRTWSDAMDQCENAMQGRLADITSLDEQMFVEGLLTESNIDDAWFGLRRVFLIWSDGSPLVYETWQNITINEESICFRIGLKGWYDTSCDRDYAFVCEMEEITTTVVTTTRRHKSTAVGIVEDTVSMTTDLATTDVPITISIGGSSKDTKGMTSALITGIAVAMVVITVLIVLIISIILRRRKPRSDNTTATAAMTPMTEGARPEVRTDEPIGYTTRINSNGHTPIVASHSTEAEDVYENPDPELSPAYDSLNKNTMTADTEYQSLGDTSVKQNTRRTPTSSVSRNVPIPVISQATDKEEEYDYPYPESVHDNETTVSINSDPHQPSYQNINNKNRPGKFRK